MYLLLYNIHLVLNLTQICQQCERQEGTFSFQRHALLFYPFLSLFLFLSIYQLKTKDN